MKKYILNFVVTPRNFIIAKLSIRKSGSSSCSANNVLPTRALNSTSNKLKYFNSRMKKNEEKLYNDLFYSSVSKRT